MAEDDADEMPQTGAGATTATTVADPADVATLDRIINALYDVISGPAGFERDVKRFHSLFAPGARLIPVSPNHAGGAAAQVLDPDAFLKMASENFKSKGFFESEIFRKVDSFGNIAHVFSTYESRRAREDEVPFARGINSIQLLRDGERWWVVTVF